ncbi:MAG: protein disulfide oxidoreductase [Candidatus Aminicenantia bacterium]
MGILKEKDKEVIKKEFAKLKNNVYLIVFTQELECEYCRETRELVEELATLSDKLKVEVYNFAIDKVKAEEYGIDKIPAIVVKGEKDYGIRFYGIPAGYEFTTLIEDIVDVSNGESGLLNQTKEKMKEIDKPVHIQVFVTPTCPYCPSAVRTAHKMAIENEFVKADMIEVIEFPHLAHKHGVMGVPKVVINDKISFEGALPEPHFLQNVLLAIGSV